MQGQQTSSARDQAVNMGDFVSPEGNGAESVDSYISTQNGTDFSSCAVEKQALGQIGCRTKLVSPGLVRQTSVH